jgi:hypothetical protein
MIGFSIAPRAMIGFWSITLVGIAVDAVLFFRGLTARLASKYPFFYFYSGSVLLGSILVVTPGIYPRGYWQTQLLTLIAGYGILLEILNHVFAPYPGADRFAKTTVVIVFVLVLGFVLIFPVIKPGTSAGTMIEFERDLRTVQAIFICALLAVISYYRIEVGRNMKGMIAGYGLYIVTSLVTLATRSYAGMAEQHVFSEPIFFDISLVIWMISLWSYSPNPVPEPRISLDTDYEAAVARTKSLFGTLRGYLVRTGRP